MKRLLQKNFLEELHRLKKEFFYPPREIEDGTIPLESEVVKIIIPSIITDKYTRLEVLLGLKLSGHTDNLTEASNVLDDLYKKVKYKTNNKIETLLITLKVIAFFSSTWNFLVNF